MSASTINLYNSISNHKLLNLSKLSAFAGNKIDVAVKLHVHLFNQLPDDKF